MQLFSWKKIKLQVINDVSCSWWHDLHHRVVVCLQKYFKNNICDFILNNIRSSLLRNHHSMLSLGGCFPLSLNLKCCAWLQAGWVTPSGIYWQQSVSLGMKELSKICARCLESLKMHTTQGFKKIIISAVRLDIHQRLNVLTCFSYMVCSFINPANLELYNR